MWEKLRIFITVIFFVSCVAFAGDNNNIPSFKTSFDESTVRPEKYDIPSWAINSKVYMARKVIPDITPKELQEIFPAVLGINVATKEMLFTIGNNFGKTINDDFDIEVDFLDTDGKRFFTWRIGIIVLAYGDTEIFEEHYDLTEFFGPLEQVEYFSIRFPEGFVDALKDGLVK